MNKYEGKMMQWSAWRLAVAAFAALAVVVVFPHFGGLAEAQGRKEVKAATGPFTYEPAVAGSTTFLDDAGEPVTVGFEVCAPGGGTVFPAGDSSATADIRVFGIEQVGDGEGNPLVQLRRLLEHHCALLEAQEGDSAKQCADDGSITVFEVSEVPQR